MQQIAAAARIAVNTFQEIDRETVDQMNAAVGYPFLLEYDYNRPPSQPATHVIRLVFSKKFGIALYTLNAAEDTLYTLVSQISHQIDFVSRRTSPHVFSIFKRYGTHCR